MEQWKDVVGAEQFYEVSNYGNVRNKANGNALKPIVGTNGYPRVELAYGLNKHRSIHRLVAEAFVDNPFCFPCVNHKDENKSNNRADNLEWCTYQYNCRYGKGALARNRKIIQYDMGGNALKIWDSMKEASVSLGVNREGISECCRMVKKTCGGFMWSYANLESVRKAVNNGN